MATNPYQQYLGDGKTLNQAYIRWQQQNPTTEQIQTVSQAGTVPGPTMIGVKFNHTPKIVAPNTPASWVQEEQNKYLEKARAGEVVEAPKPDYSSEYAIRAADISKYERNKLLKDYYTKNKMQFDPNAFPESPEAEAEYFLNQQKEQKSYLEQQVEATKAKTARQFESSAGGIRSAFAQGREGVVSAGNELIAPAFISEMEKDRQMQIAQLDQSLANLKEQQRLQQQSFSEGRQQEIAMLEANISAQKKALIEAENKRTSEARLTAQEARELRQQQFSEIQDMDLSQLSDTDIDALATSYPNLDKNTLILKKQNDTYKRQTQESKDKVATQKEYLNMIDTNIKYGVEMSPQAILQYASLSGLPVDTLLSYNEAAKQVKETKGIDEATKQAQLDKLKNDLNRTIEGLDNADIEKFTYFAKLKAAGADKETLDAFMRIAGVKDPNDPYTQAQIRNMEADYAKKLSELNGGGVVKTKTPIDEMYKLVGKKGGQCGHFVNQQLGTSFGDTYKSKQAIAKDKFPVVGGAFILPPTKKNPYGHVGIITDINGDGTVNTINSNMNFDEKITENNNMPMSSITGYYSPKTETAKADLETAWQNNYKLYQKGVLTDTTLLSTMEELGKTAQQKQEIRDWVNNKLEEKTKTFEATKGIFGMPLNYKLTETEKYPLNKKDLVDSFFK